MGDSYENWRVIEQTFVEPNYSLLSSAVLLYYDYLLTMQSEVRLVWRTPWSLATTFYIFIRYGIIIVTTLAIVHNFYISASGLIWTIETCKVLTIIGIIVNALNFAVVSAFVAIRISAIWSRNWWLGAFLFFVGLVNPACITDLLAFGFKAIPGPHPLVACVSYLKTDHNHLGPLIIKYFPISSSAISIVYELLCLSLTALKTLSLYREQRNTGISTRLTSLLLRDGILYFTTLSALALVNIISACLPLGLIPYDVQINSTLTRVLTPILTTRFIANLRAIHHPDPSSYDQNDSVTSQRSTIWFDHPDRHITSLSMPLRTSGDSYDHYSDAENDSRM